MEKEEIFELILILIVQICLFSLAMTVENKAIGSFVMLVGVLNILKEIKRVLNILKEIKNRLE